MGAYQSTKNQWPAGYGAQPQAWPQATQAQAQNWTPAYTQVFALLYVRRRFMKRLEITLVGFRLL